MTFREIEREVKADKWYFDHANGSHYIYYHPTKKGMVVIPYHSGDLHPKTIKSIRKQAGLL